MGKSDQVYVSVSPVSVNKKAVEATYQKCMAKVVQKQVETALSKAKSKGITTKKPSGKNVHGFLLIPVLKLLKNIGKGKAVKLRGEVSITVGQTKGDKIIKEVTVITKGANVTPPLPLPKKLDADYQAAVEAAAKEAMDVALKKVKGESSN